MKIDMGKLVNIMFTLIVVDTLIGGMFACLDWRPGALISLWIAFGLFATTLIIGFIDIIICAIKEDKMKKNSK